MNSVINYEDYLFFFEVYSFKERIACPDIGMSTIILKIVMRPTPIQMCKLQDHR